ncbi:MAG: DUF1864 family protein [Candidatus Vogelbacteria bacterium]|nr:DUF1864 family protein [Candidatus Vogelbacteria bacterium]
MKEQFEQTESQPELYSGFEDKIKLSIEKDVRISELDPFNADSFFSQELPELNTSKDSQKIIKVTQELINSKSDYTEVGELEAKAMVRDLGMVISSLKRHGIGLEGVPGLEEKLLELASFTNEVPRDTVFSYGPRNPINPSRTRYFTKVPEEKIFIESFREGMNHLSPAVAGLLQAHQVSPESNNFSGLVERSTKEFQGMIDAILKVRRNISPEVFTNDLRPYFDPITIGGIDYSAAGGAQMPVLLIDLIAHTSDKIPETTTYQTYFEDNIRYLPYELRSIAEEIRGKKSLLTTIIETGTAEVPMENLEALRELFTKLLQFRMPHLRIAKDNMAKRDVGARGSGGYQTEILELLIKQTQDSRNKLGEILHIDED